MKVFASLLFILLSLELPAQDVPKNIDEFKYAILNFKQPEPKQPEISPTLQRYFDNIKNTSSSMVANTGSQRDLKPLYDCIQNYNGNAIEFVNMCKTQWKAVTADQKAYLRSKNIVSPDEYIESLQREEKAKAKELESYQRPDELIVIKDFYRLKETTPEDLISLQEVDPEIKSISLDVKNIVLKMHTSSDPGTVAEKLEASKETDELIKLSELISRIGDKRNECWTNGSLVKNPEDNILKTSHAERFIIGLKGNEDISKLESYKFTDDGKTYFLYRLNDGEVSKQTWVMAHVDENGEMAFRYFELVKDQENKIEMATDHDINVIKGKLQKNTYDLNKNKIYVQMQTGLSVKGSKRILPVIGTAVIPQNEIVIGKVQMSYLTKDVLVENGLSVNYNHVALTTETAPAKNNIWSLGSGVEYNPLNGNIKLSGNVRVFDLMVGYSNNLDGGQSGKVSYILDRNFISVNSDFKSLNASLGHSLPKNKGLIMATTNFKALHEVKVIIYLDK